MRSPRSFEEYIHYLMGLGFMRSTGPNLHRGLTWELEKERYDFWMTGRPLIEGPGFLYHEINSVPAHIFWIRSGRYFYRDLAPCEMEKAAQFLGRHESCFATVDAYVTFLRSLPKLEADLSRTKGDDLFSESRSFRGAERARVSARAVGWVKDNREVFRRGSDWFAAWNWVNHNFAWLFWKEGKQWWMYPLSFEQSQGVRNFKEEKK